MKQDIARSDDANTIACCTIGKRREAALECAVGKYRRADGESAIECFLEEVRPVEQHLAFAGDGVRELAKPFGDSILTAGDSLHQLILVLPSSR